ncbi:EVE domain-containing protein [Iodobacter fluviatilis]|uniref:EVE domain n=1 Tax=Iodobacter fluviatilis TaxID=537 RepID=A0A377SSH8_9NEIS|nr:EVE domain-containing protein [Iodobacter fluviatilis]TCU85528.1 putative RNA-binding protein with PUA-like domain [Iodobacter fluviatilis]STR45024.1 EVE domain [Iodobacter fluviatilis]
MNYWLMKSEPDDVSIDDLVARPDQTVGWYGVRNYQARNFMRDEMQLGDPVFFYHSSCKEPGIAGLATVCRLAYPDPTQFDATSEYFDGKSTPEKPRWLQVDVRFVKKTRLLSLSELRSFPELAQMVLLQKGSRLSITPVSAADAAFILAKLC